jgi:PhnB protein
MEQTPQDIHTFIPLSSAVFHILLTLLDEDIHGYQIMKKTTDITNGAIRLGAGTLYRSLQQMLKNELIEAFESDVHAHQDERRKYYRITPLGRAVLLEESQRLYHLVQLASQHDDFRGVLETAPMAGEDNTPQGMSAVPPDVQTLTPRLTVHDAEKAIDFYCRIFDADELFRSTPTDSGDILHADLLIGNSRLQITQEKSLGNHNPSPKSLKGTSFIMVIYVENVEHVHQRAIESGATSLYAPKDQIWGDRYSIIEDPFGYQWGLSSRIQDPSPEEIIDRANKLYGGKKTS